MSMLQSFDWWCGFVSGVIGVAVPWLIIPWWTRRKKN